MRPLSVSELLTLWERELASRPCERALAILAAASPDSSRDALARASIGRRDACLLTVREWAFGPELSVLADCPRCRQPLETVLRVDDLRAPMDAEDETAEGAIVCGEYSIRFRAPNTGDLLACGGLDAEAMREQLFASCVLEARRGREPVAASDLPADVARRTIDAVSAIDPQADARLSLVCAECGHRWDEVFDIASVFWSEIDAWARRVLREVATLARAYGWRERDILALSPMRRQIYVAMAHA